MYGGGGVIDECYVMLGGVLSMCENFRTLRNLAKKEQNLSPIVLRFNTTQSVHTM